MKRLRIVHVIPNLASGGGAQSALYRLVRADAHNEHVVVVLIAPRELGDDLLARGVEVISLRLGGASSLPRALWTLHGIIRTYRPDAVQTWMYHADLLGGVVARLAGCRHVFWGLRHSTFERHGSSLSSRLAAWLCARLSRYVPRRIVSCSTVAVDVHVAAGYDPGRMVVIPNGYDPERFVARTTPSASAAARRSLGLPGEGRLLGMAARWDPQKDHANLLEALCRLRDSGVDDWVCVLFGARMDAGNSALVELLESHDLGERVVLLGIRRDAAAVMGMLDLSLLSSRFGEAFPNVLAESMLTGTPCVSTRVGDAALIVGDTGWTVPPAEPDAFAAALAGALSTLQDSEAWVTRRQACRLRIVSRFGVERMRDAYIAVWKQDWMEGRPTTKTTR